MICAYGNCHENCSINPLPVVVSTSGATPERKRFCSEFHGALWLLGRAASRERNVNRRVSALALIEASYKE